MTEEIINKIKFLISENKLIEAEKLIKESNFVSDQLFYLAGLVKYKLNKNEEAIDILKKIINKVPDIYLLMSNINENLSLYSEALNLLDKAIQIQDNFWKAYFNKGILLMKIKKFKEAKESFEKVLKIDPNNDNAEYYLGFLSAGYDLKVAEKHYRRSILLNPNNENAHSELGKLLLFDGNLKDGWNEYEWRFRYLEKIYPENIINIPIWNGKNIEKNRFLIFREQGLGDEILYASCYGELIKKAEKCFFISDGRLVNIFKESFPKAEFINEEVFSKNTDLTEIKPTVRIQSPLIPKYIRKNFKDFPKQKKYLIADKKKSEMWKKRLFKDGKNKLKIGLAWSSSASEEKDKEIHTQSPIEFKINEWKHFLSIDKIFLINLMYKDEKNEINLFNKTNKNKIFTYKDLDMKDDIDNVAALISNLDIVISAQTWIGDFASALGVDVFKFHNKNSLTRLGQEKIPWNNSLIFDGRNNNWKESFELIKSLLNERMVK